MGRHQWTPLSPWLPGSRCGDHPGEQEADALGLCGGRVLHGRRGGPASVPARETAAGTTDGCGPALTHLVERLSIPAERSSCLTQEAAVSWAGSALSPGHRPRPVVLRPAAAACTHAPTLSAEQLPPVPRWRALPGAAQVLTRGAQSPVSANAGLSGQVLNPSQHSV